MINEVLDLSKIEAQKMELEHSVFHLQQFLDALVDIVRFRAEQKHLVFHSEIADQLPRFVEGDEKRLRQVLLNLLSNAIKFTNQGRITFRTSLVHVEAQSVIFRFEVLDEGIGIPEEKIDEIFLPFYQVKNTQIQTEGTGLGLSISQKLVHLMGSTIHVKSQLNNGSTFWFDLNLLKYPETDNTGVNVNLQEHSTESHHEHHSPNIPDSSLLLPPRETIELLYELSLIGDIFNLQAHVKDLERQNAAFQPFAHYISQLAKEFMLNELQEISQNSKGGRHVKSEKMREDETTILVADDHPMNLRVLLDSLREQRYRILIARNGEGALRQAILASPDLILLDVMMPPGIDGFETCRRLKQQEATKEIPVIFMTALSDSITQNHRI